MIVLAPDEVQVQMVSVEVQERFKAGRKRAKKIRQRISAKTKDYKGHQLSVLRGHLLSIRLGKDMTCKD